MANDKEFHLGGLTFSPITKILLNSTNILQLFFFVVIYCTIILDDYIDVSSTIFTQVFFWLSATITINQSLYWWKSTINVLLMIGMLVARSQEVISSRLNFRLTRCFLRRVFWSYLWTLIITATKGIKKCFIFNFNSVK